MQYMECDKWQLMNWLSSVIKQFELIAVSFKLFRHELPEDGDQLKHIGAR